MLDTVDLSKQFRSELIEILTVNEELLVHPHSWVRESASTLVQSVLGAADDLELTNALGDYWTAEKAKSLALKVVCQLKCKFVDRDHMGPCKRLLLLFLTLFKRRLPNAKPDSKPDLLYLVQKLNGVAAEENSDRSAIFSTIIFRPKFIPLNFRRNNFSINNFRIFLS